MHVEDDAAGGMFQRLGKVHMCLVVVARVLVRVRCPNCFGALLHGGQVVLRFLVIGVETGRGENNRNEYDNSTSFSLFCDMRATAVPKQLCKICVCFLAEAHSLIYFPALKQALRAEKMIPQSKRKQSFRLQVPAYT